MKYCLVEQKKDCYNYDTDFPFVYSGHCVMRRWRPNDANKIELFNSIQSAEKYIKDEGSWFAMCGPIEVVPAEDVLIMIAEMKLAEKF